MGFGAFGSCSHSQLYQYKVISEVDKNMVPSGHPKYYALHYTMDPEA